MVDLIWIAALIVFAIWWFIVVDLEKAGILKKHNFSSIGPILILRTFRGQRLLDRLARPKKFWRAMITICLPLVFACMAGMFALVISACIWAIINAESVPSPGPLTNPVNAIAIPGINQFIPFWWGWLALIIAMVAHEFSHAILAKSENVSVKSLGVLLIPVPIGAFAEIDEEEMFGTKSDDVKSDVIGPLETKAPGQGKRKTSTMQFIRIISAGVIANFIVAAIVFALLFGPVLGSVAATNNGLLVASVAPGSQADMAGIKPNALIMSVDGRNITTIESFNDYIRSVPDKDVVISGIQDGNPVSYTMHVNETFGVFIHDINSPDQLPAYSAGITPNMRIIAINGTRIPNATAFTSYMENTTPNQTVTLTTVDPKGVQKDISIVLGPGTGTKGYIGVLSSDNPLGIIAYIANAQGYLDGLKKMPFSVYGWIRIVYMPVLQFVNGDPGFGIFHTPYAGMYTVTGWAAPLGSHIYDLIDCLYWIGWLNIALATCNCLPMIPLDGGHIFREVVRRFIEPIVKDQAKAEKICGVIVNGFAVALLAAIVFMMAAPYLVHWTLG